jgi:hypothetical protein
LAKAAGGRASIDTAAAHVDKTSDEHSNALQALAVGIAAWFSNKWGKPNKRPRATRHAGEIVEHAMARYRNGWKCENCDKIASDRAEWIRTRRNACVGPSAMRAASSHALAYMSESRVTVCLRCGAWATRRPKHLLKRCVRAPPTYGHDRCSRESEWGCTLTRD